MPHAPAHFSSSYGYLLAVERREIISRPQLSNHRFQGPMQPDADWPGMFQRGSQQPSPQGELALRALAIIEQRGFLWAPWEWWLGRWWWSSELKCWFWRGNWHNLLASWRLWNTPPLSGQWTLWEYCPTSGSQDAAKLC